MTEHPHIVNNIHASVLIGAGLTSYFLNEKRPGTALIPPALGSSLLLLSPGIKKGNKAVAHAAVGLTGAMLAMTSRMFLKAVNPDEDIKQKFTKDVLTRRATVFGLMSITGLAALGVYGKGFINKRNQA